MKKICCENWLRQGGFVTRCLQVPEKRAEHGRLVNDLNMNKMINTQNKNKYKSTKEDCNTSPVCNSQNSG